MPDTPVSPPSALSEIKGLIAERDALAARMDWSVVVGASMFDVAQDKLAARAPSLVAAIEAAMNLADEWDASGDVGRQFAARGLRETVTEALTATPNTL